jgi:hypothetical protein
MTAAAVSAVAAAAADVAVVGAASAVAVVVVGAAAVVSVSEAGLLASVAAGALVASDLVAVAVVVGVSDRSLAFTFVATVSPVRESSALVSPGKRVALKEKCCLAVNCCARAGLLASTIKPISRKLLLTSFDHVPLLLCPFIW